MNMDKEKELEMAYEALSSDEEFALTKVSYQ